MTGNVGEHESDSQVIAQNVARLRKEANMSQTALADAMRAAGEDHWRQNTVSRVETGKQELTTGEAHALYGILGPVFTGTRVDEMLRQFGQEQVRHRTVVGLRDADKALSEALATIRDLRKLHGDLPTDGD